MTVAIGLVNTRQPQVNNMIYMYILFKIIIY